MRDKITGCLNAIGRDAEVLDKAVLGQLDAATRLAADAPEFHDLEGVMNRRTIWYILTAIDSWRGMVEVLLSEDSDDCGAAR